MRKSWTSVLGALCAALLTQGAQAAPAAAATPEVVRIWPGAAPGTTWTGPEREMKMPIQPGGEVVVGVMNVTTPTLTVFRPEAGKATGAAMIVAPGGGFVGLAFQHEGTDVARWLAERGVTAFVLKYRVHLMPGFRLPSADASDAELDKLAASMEPSRRLAVADGVQAMRYLRAHAAQYGIASNKIGMMGFSAGAMTTMGVVMDSEPADRPDLAAPIYGVMERDKAPPSGGPPVFIAAAADDPLIPPSRSIQIFTAWHAAKLPAELHIYEKGSHGFGMLKRHTTSDDWPHDFEVWLWAHGWIAADAGH